jgi:cobalt-zinc-cadmium efflux system protein
MERDAEIRRLIFALSITSVYFGAEVLGGLLTNSLALLSDAGHMFSDIGAMALGLFAFVMARRPVTLKRTYGYHRLEILAALINGLSLWLIVGVIFHAAYNRLLNPPEVQSLGMLVIAAVGLLVNIAAAIILYPSHHKNLNMHGAFLHITGDALGSIGAIMAGATMLWTGWYIADPIISVFIGVLILYTSWTLVKDSVNILMQSVPKGISLEEVQSAIERVDGVYKVHDLHVWAVTSDVFTLSAHAVTEGDHRLPDVLNDIEIMLKERFRIEHTTIQLEVEDRTEKEFQAF